MADFSDNIFDEVNQKADIVKVVSYYLGATALTRKSGVYYSLCPFHKDSHPSFRIDPKRNTCKCFSCGTGGNPISFVMKFAHLEAMDALRKVCEICAIPVPESARNSHAAPDLIKEKYAKELQALELLAKFYQLTLKSNDGEEGRKYLEGRKLPNEAIEKFKIGFAPMDTHAAINSLRKNGFDVKTLETAGIVSGGSDLKDRYQRRIMFPLEDIKGRIVGFSGRIISKDQEGGKYINYPETPLFEKKDILYHFHDAREIAKKSGYLYVVEGYMDVIAFVRAGEEAVVGVMGTALTPEHCSLIKHLGVEVRLCLDRDEAGQMNEERCLALFHQFKIPCRVVRKFKNGKDADEVLTNAGAAVLMKEATQFLDPFLFFLGRALSGRTVLTDSTEITSFLNKATPYFEDLSEAGQANDLKILSKVTGLDIDTLSDIIHRVPPKKKKNYPEENGKDNGYHWTRKKKPVVEFSNFNITSGTATVVNLVTEIKNIIYESGLAQGILPELIQTDCEIISAIPFVGEQADYLDTVQFNFGISIFDPLCSAFRDSITLHPKRVDHILLPEDFDEIIQQSAPVEKDETSDEDSELNELLGMEDDDVMEQEGGNALSKLTDSQKEILFRVIRIIKLIQPSTVDKDNFIQNVKKDTELGKYNQRILASRQANGGKMDEQTKMELRKDMRKKHIHIKSFDF